MMEGYRASIAFVMFVLMTFRVVSP